jgi:hypothetical protein
MRKKAFNFVNKIRELTSIEIGEYFWDFMRIETTTRERTISISASNEKELTSLEVCRLFKLY